jgi:hypothetical protein
MNSEVVIEIVKAVFKMFYGNKYDELIDKRMKNLVDIVFYNNHVTTNKLDTIEDYLKEYGINKYNDEIIEKKIPISKYVLETGQQGTMIYENDDELKMIIYFPKSTINQYNYDCILIHELLHVIDEHIIYQDNDVIISQGGFEKMCIKGEKELDRNFEYLNEIIHQRIAEEINEYMYDNDILLINTREEKEKSINKYKKDRCPVVEKFYYKYKNILLNDKLIGNIEDFIKKVGENYFIKFNKWINNFYDNYPTPTDRLEKSNTKEYKKMIDEGIAIINSMNN